MNKTVKTALMISGGFIVGDELKTYVEQNTFDFIMGVDGGCQVALDIGVKLDLMYGDFDTLKQASKEVLLRQNTSMHQLSPIKDLTDTHGAFLELIKRGVGYVSVFGCTGTRMDHTMANLMVPFQFLNKVEVVYFDHHNRIRFYQGECTVAGQTSVAQEEDGDRYTYLSIIPVEKTLVSQTSGLKYNVVNQVFEPYDSFGVSNEIIDDYEIKVKYGKFMIVEARD